MLRHLRGRGSRLIYPLAALWLQTLVMAGGVEAQSLSFIARRDFAAGSGPVSLAVGDFNGDRVQDLAVANSRSNNVSVLRGNGDGTFQTPRNFAVGSYPSSVAVGDFNGDGLQDLAVANYTSNNVSVLRGNGDGTFQVGHNFGAGRSPTSVAVGDFDRDRRQDLAVANARSNDVSVLRGNGDGTFQTALNFAVGSNPISLAVGDFNGDGLQDLAATNYYSNNLSVLRSNGDGTFQTARNFVVGSYPTSVVAKDFNGDALEDLAVVSSWSNNVAVLLGNRDGTFQTSLNFDAVKQDYMAVGDFNGDGLWDLAVVSWYSTSVSVLLGNGDGTFQPPLNFTAGYGPNSPAVGDFNGDGLQDLALANGGSDDVSVLRGNGDGTFQTAWSFGIGGVSVAVGDFNGDGLQDLALANFRNISVLDLTFQTARNVSVGINHTSVAVGDFNGDGRLDLAVADAGDPEEKPEPRSIVAVLRGNGDGTFQAAVNFGVGSHPVSIAVADFNGDAVQDLAVANSRSNNVAVLRGNGDGTFQAAVNFGAGISPTSLAVGDFNGDGRRDLVVANAGNSVSVLRGNGDGTFQAAVNFGAGISPASVAVGDFNGDGVQDLAVANRVLSSVPGFPPGNVSVLRGNGDGTFQTAVNFAAGINPASVAVGDLNGDGVQDLAVANDYSNNVSVLLGNGNGTFQTALNFGVGGHPISVAVADFNGDGFQDLAVANDYSNNVSVLINKLKLSFTSVLPQIAVGAGYRTSVIGVNTGATSAAVEASFRKSDGSPFRVTGLSVVADNVFASRRIIAPMGTARLEAPSTGELAAGYATFRSNMALNGTVLLKRMSGNTITSQTGLALSTPTKNFTAYVDNANNALSGYAVANFGTVHATLAMTLRNKKGMMLETQTVNLGPGRHFAEFASERFPTTAGAGFEGSIEFTSDQSVAAVAVRYDNINLDVFTTIPVLVNEMATTLYFPQVADGATYRTNFILVNPSNAAAFATLEFFDSNGAPLAFPIEGVERIRHIVPLSGKGVARLVTDGTSSGIKVGWVRVTCPVAIGGSAIFQTVVRERITSEAGVGASPLAARFLTYVESLGFAESGLALCNPGSFGLTVTFNLRNFSGRIVASTRRTLPAFGHMAQFFTQLFPTDFGEFEGTLEVVVAGAPVSAVALRYDNPGADVFATLPVIVIP